MAAAVERVVPAGLLVAPPLNSRGGKTLEEKINVQNIYLAYYVVRDMLKEDNLNGLSHSRLLGEGQWRHEYINEAGFKEALQTLKDICRHFKATKACEMESLVGTLDITDTQLYTNYLQVAQHLLVLSSEVRFGRIGSLFFFTYLLCKRLHRDSRLREVDSVIDWLAQFLNENITPWLIQKHGGKWVCTVTLSLSWVTDDSLSCGSLFWL